MLSTTAGRGVFVKPGRCARKIDPPPAAYAVTPLRPTQTRVYPHDHLLELPRSSPLARTAVSGNSPANSVGTTASPQALNLLGHRRLLPSPTKTARSCFEGDMAGGGPLTQQCDLPRHALNGIARRRGRRDHRQHARYGEKPSHLASTFDTKTRMRIPRYEAGRPLLSGHWHSANAYHRHPP